MFTKQCFKKYHTLTLTIFRVIAGLMFFQHGAQKVFGWIGGNPDSLPALMSMSGIAGLMELIGGILIIIGLFTRPVAGILALEMAVAYFMVHATKGFWPIMNHGELAMAYLIIFLYLSAAGGGKFSIDGIICKGKHGDSCGV